MQRAAQHQRDQRGNGADHERNAPAPGAQLIFAQQLLQNHHHQHRQQLAADQGHVLERGEEAALATQGHFTHVGGGGAVLAAYRQALDQAGQQQQRRGPGADAGVGGQAGDHQGAEAHHQHRDHQGILATMTVSEAAEDPATDGAHQKTRGEHACRVQQLHGGVVGGEEGRGKVDRAEGVDVEVEPFHQVA
ncbi:hypothetical protein D9M71_622200 [compost metagenome]